MIQQNTSEDLKSFFVIILGLFVIVSVIIGHILGKEMKVQDEQIKLLSNKVNIQEKQIELYQQWLNSTQKSLNNCWNKGGNK